MITLSILTTSLIHFLVGRMYVFELGSGRVKQKCASFARLFKIRHGQTCGLEDAVNDSLWSGLDFGRSRETRAPGVQNAAREKGLGLGETRREIR